MGIGRVVRAVGTGVGLAAGGMAVSTRGFTRVPGVAAHEMRRMNNQWGTTGTLTAIQLPTFGAAGGGLFGLGYLGTARRVHLPPLLTGAAYGTSVWLAYESLFRAFASSRTAKWGVPPTAGVVLAVFGSAVAWATEGRGRPSG